MFAPSVNHIGHEIFEFSIMNEDDKNTSVLRGRRRVCSTGSFESLLVKIKVSFYFMRLRFNSVVRLNSLFSRNVMKSLFMSKKYSRLYCSNIILVLRRVTTSFRVA